MPDESAGLLPDDVIKVQPEPRARPPRTSAVFTNPRHLFFILTSWLLTATLRRQQTRDLCTSADKHCAAVRLTERMNIRELENEEGKK